MSKTIANRSGASAVCIYDPTVDAYTMLAPDQLAELRRQAARWAEVEALAAGGAAVLVEHDGEGLVAHRLNMPSGQRLYRYTTVRRDASAPAGKGR